jgi:hypothetical protein
MFATIQKRVRGSTESQERVQTSPTMLRKCNPSNNRQFDIANYIAAESDSKRFHSIHSIHLGNVLATAMLPIAILATVA